MLSTRGACDSGPTIHRPKRALYVYWLVSTDKFGPVR